LAVERRLVGATPLLAAPLLAAGVEVRAGFFGAGFFLVFLFGAAFFCLEVAKSTSPSAGRGLSCRDGRRESQIFPDDAKNRGSRDQAGVPL